jgi:hypothetical protein
MNLPSVKTVGNTAAKFAAATGGLTIGAMIAAKIPVPAVGPALLQEHMKKAVPGLAVMIAAFVASKYKSKHELVEPAAIGMGLAGFANLVKMYAPDLAAKFIPLQGPYVPPGSPDFVGIDNVGEVWSDRLNYQLGEGEPSFETMKLTA